MGEAHDEAHDEAGQAAGVDAQGVGAPDRLMRITELAELAGMSVRNIRARQSRGLLPPATRVGRTSFYDERHLLRLRQIADLQHDGFNLAAISVLLDAAAPAAGDAEGPGRLHAFSAALRRERQSRERPLTAEGLRALQALGPDTLTELTRLGLIRHDDTVGWLLSDPVFVEQGRQLLTLGLPLEEIFAVTLLAGELAEHTAERLVAVFRAQVWQPFVDGGLPLASWAGVRAAYEAVHASAESIALVFRLVMERRAAELLAGLVDEVSEEPPEG